VQNRKKYCQGISFFVALMLVLPAVSGATEVSGNPEELKQFLRSDVRTVSLQNNANETAYTDIAKITLVVVTKEKLLSESINENTQLRADLTRRLIESGISPESIRSSKYSASPQYRWFGKSPANFEVVNSVVVEVDSEAQFLEVSSQADASDAISFGGVVFELKDEQAFENQVRDKAMQAVLADAAYFEERLGLSLKPVAFSYSPVNRRNRGNFGAIEEIIVTASRAKSESSEPPAPRTTFDEVQFSVSVQVTFEVVRQ